MSTIDGTHLKAWREMAGLTQEEMGLLLKVNKRTIGQWERGRVMPPWVAERLHKAATSSATTFLRRHHGTP